MKVKKKGYYSNSKMKMTATETSRKVEFEIPAEEVENVTAGLIKIQHQKGLYDEFFTLNQQFLKYVLTIGLKGKDWDVFIWLTSKMDYGNKILVNQEFICESLNRTRSQKISQGQVSKALKKLRDNKVILETKYNTAKYEVGFNYDIINPQMAFKGKATKKNVKEHKKLIGQETPYIKQYNINGDIDLIVPSTGEVFGNQKSDYEK